MKKDTEYIIPFVGLKEGVHHYQFSITNTFFEAFDYTDLRGAEVEVELVMEKKSTMLVFDFFISGDIVTACDRCSDDVKIAIKGDYQVIGRFTEENYEETEDIFNLSSSEHEVDVKAFIYEFIHLSLPSKTVHEEGECNPEMLAQLEKYLISNEPTPEDESNKDKEVDPRWAALKKLK